MQTSKRRKLIHMKLTCLIMRLVLLFLSYFFLFLRYRRLALKFHPKRNREPGSSQKFTQLGEAYDVLSDRKWKNIGTDVCFILETARIKTIRGHSMITV